MNELSLFNSLFDDGDFGFFPAVAKNYSFGVPQVDVKETKDAYALEMDLPGRTEKDVDVDLKDNVLTIASHTEETKEEKSRIKRKERYSGSSMKEGQVDSAAASLCHRISTARK